MSAAVCEWAVAMRRASTMTCGQGRSYGEGRAQEGGVMAPEKAAGSTRRRGGQRRGKSEPAAGKDAAPSTLVDIDPWGAFLEHFSEHPNEGAPADERSGERKPSTRKPVKKPGPRRSTRS